MGNTNVTPEEVAKFDALAKDWWNPEGPMKPLHQMNPVRLSFIESHVSLTGKQALDVGCGAGLLSEAMSKAGAQVTGIDQSESALTIATQHAQQNKLDINYQKAIIEEFAEKNPAKFDVVTCLELLEHVPDPQAIMQACTDLCKPNGKIFFSTINRNVLSYLQAIIGAEYILQWLPKGTHEYKKLIKPSEMDRWARAANLQLDDLKGLIYHPTSGTFSISANVSVNYIACYKKAS